MISFIFKLIASMSKLKVLCFSMFSIYIAYTYYYFSMHVLDLVLLLSLNFVLSSSNSVKEKVFRVKVSVFIGLFMSIFIADGILCTSEQFKKLNDFVAYNQPASRIIKDRGIDLGSLGYLQANRLLTEFRLRGFDDKKPSDLEVELK